MLVPAERARALQQLVNSCLPSLPDPCAGCHTGLNAIPLLEEYRSSPQGNVHLLLTGLGAVAGQLASLDLQGQPSMAFHGDPALMRHDPYRWGSEHRVSLPRHIHTLIKPLTGLWKPHRLRVSEYFTIP